MSKILLFEQILQEADKSRFIDKALASEAAKEVLHDSDLQHYRDLFIKFINTGASDKYKINWQQDPNGLFNELYSSYSDYISNGGSLRNRKNKIKKNPKELFKESGLNISDEKSATENTDIVILDSLENKDYIFAIPMTYESCVWMDSFNCGGFGAKWCIGTSDNTYYWNDYTNNRNNLFCFILNKNELANPKNIENNLKFMLCLTTEGLLDTKAWTQDDEEEHTIRPFEVYKKFNHTINEIAEKIYNVVKDFSNAYTKSYLWFRWEDLAKSGKFYNDDLSKGFVLSVHNDLLGKSLDDLIYLIGSHADAESVIIDGDNYGKKTSLVLDKNNIFIEEYGMFNYIDLTKVLGNLCQISNVTFKNIVSDRMYLRSPDEITDIDSYIHNYFILPKITFENCEIDKLIISEEFMLYAQEGTYIKANSTNDITLYMSGYKYIENVNMDINGYKSYYFKYIDDSIKKKGVTLENSRDNMINDEIIKFN